MRLCKGLTYTNPNAKLHEETKNDEFYFYNDALFVSLNF